MRRMLFFIFILLVFLVLFDSCSLPVDNLILSNLGKASVSVDWGNSINQKSITITESDVESVVVIIDDKINNPDYSYTFKKDGWGVWTLSLPEGYHKITAIDEGKNATNSSNQGTFEVRPGKNINITIQPGGGVFIGSNL